MNFYQQVDTHFSQAIHAYENASLVQQKAAAYLGKLIKDFQNHYQNIIDLGCGTGLNTQTILETLSFNDLTLCDLSEPSLELARQHLWMHTPKSIQMNFDWGWDLEHKFDLIFSNMALQWSLNLPKLIQKTWRFLESDGVLAFAIPIQGSLIELETIGFSINPLPILSEVKSILRDNHFHLKTHNEIRISQQFSNVFKAVNSIKGYGGHTKQAPFNQKFLKRKVLSEPTTLSYRIAFILAQKRSL